MKILTFYTDTHVKFKPIFEQTLSAVSANNHEIIIQQIEQTCPTGDFASTGWNMCMTDKIKFILDSMDSMSDDEYFIFSDIDVQFFDDPGKYANKILKNHDIVYQNDYYGHACAGFFYARNNDNNKKLFSAILDIIKDFRDDQDATNHILKHSKINYALLPIQYFTFGMFYKHWNGEENFPLPNNIIMHHANWVIGVDKKLKLMKVVKHLYDIENNNK